MHGNENPNPNPEDDLDNVGAGEEIDPNVIDDAERDEIAAREREAAERGEEPPTTEAILDDVRKAMTEAGGEEEPKKDKPDKPAPKDDAGKGSDKPAEGAQPPAAKPEDEAARKAAEDAEAQRKAEVDKEADQLGIKSKRARDRFHELNRLAGEHGETTKALAELAGKDKDGKEITGPAAVTAIKERITRHEQFEDAIFNSGVTSEDFKNVAGYKAAINSDDPVAWENARKFLQNELNWLETERMGLRPKEDGVQAYEAHDDLKAEVASGELSQKRANEIAATRGVQASAAKAREERQQAQGTEAQRKAATDTCSDVAGGLQAADPAQWAAKWPALKPQLTQIQSKFPPEQWVGKMVEAYRTIAYTPAPVAPQTPEQPQRRAPLRPGQLPRAGARRPPGRDAQHPMQRAEPEDPFAAMKAAMAEAGGATQYED